MRYTLSARVAHGDLKPIGRFAHNESIDGYQGGFSNPVGWNVLERILRLKEKTRAWSKEDITRVRELTRIYMGAYFPKDWHDWKLSPGEYALMEAARVDTGAYWALEGER